MNATYTYTLENSRKACATITGHELTEIEKNGTLSEFRGACDLPDGVEFASGTDENGEKIKVYRQSE